MTAGVAAERPDQPPEEPVATPSDGSGADGQVTVETRPADTDPAVERGADAAEATGDVRPRRPWWRRHAEMIAYLSAAVGSVAAMTWSMQLWRADLWVPFYYWGDAISSAAHVKATMEWGWYEYQPDLGAPAGQIYHEYPFGDNLPLIFARAASWFTDSWPLAFNVYYLLGFPLAALAALWFFRRCRISRPIAVALAVLFAVAPYHWMRNESHYYLAGYWAIPFGIWAAWQAMRGQPIWGRVATDPASRRLGRRVGRFFAGHGILVLLALALLATSSAYYAVFAALLIGVGSVVALVRTHSWRRFCGGISAIAVLGAVVVLNVLPDVLYQRAHPGGEAAFARNYADVEVYALKITSLVLPAPGHQWPLFARIRNWYDGQFPLGSEQPALGMAGGAGLIIGLAIAVYAVTRGLRIDRETSTRAPRVVGRGSTLLSLSGLTLVMILLSTVGGIGVWLVVLTNSIRGWNRMSIFIALTCLAILGVIADILIGRWTGRRRQAAARVLPRLVIAGLLVVVGTVDQAIGAATPPYAETAASWSSDAAFVSEVESAAGAGSMIFQTPFIAFPEGGPVNNAAESDAVRLSLHSTSLRWSGGGLKGSPDADWPLPVSELPAEDMVVALAAMGFAGIVTDAPASPDGGTALNSELQLLLGPPAVVSADGHWAYFSLSPVIAQVDARTTPEQRADFTQLMLTDPRAAVQQLP